MEAAAGWIEIDDPSGSGATALQKGDAVLLVSSNPASGVTARQLLQIYVDAESSGQTTFGGDSSGSIAFGDIRELSLGRYDAAAVAFRGVSSIPYDGEAIMVFADGNAVLFQTAAPQGDFDAVVGDVEAMAASVRVGP